MLFKKGRKLGARNITKKQKYHITQDVIKTTSIPEVAKKHNLSESTIRKIIRNNTELAQDIKDNLQRSMETGAGLVGNLAIEALKNKKLSKEKPKSLAYISSEMHKIITGERIPLQINVNMPVRREEMIDFLKNKEVIEKSIDIESANNEQMQQ